MAARGTRTGRRPTYVPDVEEMATAMVRAERVRSALDLLPNEQRRCIDLASTLRRAVAQSSDMSGEGFEWGGVAGCALQWPFWIVVVVGGIVGLVGPSAAQEQDVASYAGRWVLASGLDDRTGLDVPRCRRSPLPGRLAGCGGASSSRLWDQSRS